MLAARIGAKALALRSFMVGWGCGWKSGALSPRRAGGVNAFYQKVAHRRHGSGAMAELVLRPRWEFGEGVGVATGDKQGVVTEASGTPFGADNRPLNRA